MQYSIKVVFPRGHPPYFQNFQLSVLRTLKVYTYSLYGSNLRELGGDMANQVFNAWWIGVRLPWMCLEHLIFRYCNSSSVKVVFKMKVVFHFSKLLNFFLCVLG
jgi:hypothetical protein